MAIDTHGGDAYYTHMDESTNPVRVTDSEWLCVDARAAVETALVNASTAVVYAEDAWNNLKEVQRRLDQMRSALKQGGR